MLLVLLAASASHAQAPSLAVVQAQQNFNPNSGATSITANITTTAGNLLVAFVREGSNATDNFTVTDSAGQSWAQAGAYKSLNSLNRSAIFYMANSAAVTSVTANFTTNGGVVRAGIVVYEISGPESVSPIDAGPAANVSTSSTSITSSPLSTTSGNDILLFAVDVSGNQSGTNNSFVPGAGFSFPATGSATTTRQAVAYQIASSTQTNLTTSMSWGTAVGNGDSQFIAFKATS
ncbi:MAG TPA: hypothetical protein VE734_04970, partial [Terriglobales bacterium]|nr:hypothetical protein [Terriglobales bacterium]